MLRRLAIVTLATLLTYLRMPLSAPTLDAWFVEIDAYLGYHWPSFLALVDRVPAISIALAWNYNSALLQIVTVIVLLASDLGYSLDQIVAAAEAGNLANDGRLYDAAGTVLAPELVPTLLLEENAQPVEGFRSPKKVRVGVNEMVSFLNIGYGEDYGALVTLTSLVRRGYSFEQIVEAVAFNQRINILMQLLEEDGTPVVPAAPYVELPPEATTTTTTPPDENSLAALIEQAVGVYPVSQDLVGQVSPVYTDLTSIVLTGEMVVEADGTVSGTLSFTVTQTVTPIDEPTVVIVSVHDYTLAPASLELRDGGLGFTSDVVFHIVWNGEDAGTHALVGTGTVDPVGGTIAVSGLFITDTIDTARFVRAG